jgi:hypothetical protein
MAQGNALKPARYVGMAARIPRGRKSTESGQNLTRPVKPGWAGCRKAAACLRQEITGGGPQETPAGLVGIQMTGNPALAPRVLIIENDFLIGEMLHDMVAELGYSVTKVAHRLPSALNEISKENFDGALVNIGIDDQKHGNDIADILLAKNIPLRS